MKKHMRTLSACAALSSIGCAQQTPTTITPKNQKVILVHGIFRSGKNMRPVQRELERHGYECICPSLYPADASDGLEPLAKQLKQSIDEHVDGPFHLVGYSMGGIVSRYYLENLGGAEKCLSLTTIASPNNGTSVAMLYPSKGVKQMRRDSAFLTALNQQSLEASYKHVTFRTPFDLAILPSRSSELPTAENYKLYSLAHPLTLYSKQLHQNLLQTFASFRQKDKNS